LGDISDRLRDVLTHADYVYAEDTRRTSILLDHIGASVPLRSLFVGNEQTRSEEVVAAVSTGSLVALVTDAGMPGVSDPGMETVSKARAAGLPITVIPGPSAVTSAVAVAGFGADRFVFEGFLPKKGKERESRLAQMAWDDRPVVLFASRHRLMADLTSLTKTLGEGREVAIVRELTKLHEEIWTGSLGEAIEEWGRRDVKGEITVVVAPGAPPEISEEKAIAAARSEVERGASPSLVAREVAESTGVSRRKIYQALIADQDVN
jgi:16S rRNA (cytidine1402-2'-O)-methyltransferase